MSRSPSAPLRRRFAGAAWACILLTASSTAPAAVILDGTSNTVTPGEQTTPGDIQDGTSNTINVGGGIDVSVPPVVSVPEPSTFWLMLVPLVVLGLLRRRARISEG